jgi:predicted house-cleaning noncanonical NTP pyrophosphatase (MazG superfamily)
MNIYLNEESIEINSAEKSKIVEKISSKLEEEIIEKIYLDEIEVDLDYFINNDLNLERFNEIKFISKDTNKLISETLQEAEEYLPKLKEGLKNTAEELRRDNVEDASQFLNQSLDGLEWYLHVLNSILDLRDEDILTQNLKKYIEKFNLALNRAVIALKKEEYNDLADLLEAEIISYLDTFSEFNKQLLEDN